MGEQQGRVPALWVSICTRPLLFVACMASVFPSFDNHSFNTLLKYTLYLPFSTHRDLEEGMI